MHAGDFMNAGYDLREVVSFNRWLGEQPFAHRIVCGGNHDRPFENSPELARSLLSNGIYLEDSGTTIAGFSFWGSPYTPAFLYWAFMYPRSEAANEAVRQKRPKVHVFGHIHCSWCNTQLRHAGRFESLNDSWKMCGGDHGARTRDLCPVNLCPFRILVAHRYRLFDRLTVPDKGIQLFGAGPV